MRRCRQRRRRKASSLAGRDDGDGPPDLRAAGCRRDQGRRRQSRAARLHAPEDHRRTADLRADRDEPRTCHGADLGVHRARHSGQADARRPSPTPIAIVPPGEADDPQLGRRHRLGQRDGRRASAHGRIRRGTRAGGSAVRRGLHGRSGRVRSRGRRHRDAPSPRDDRRLLGRRGTDAPPRLMLAAPLGDRAVLDLQQGTPVPVMQVS